jgi:hypothetical protein
VTVPRAWRSGWRLPGDVESWRTRLFSHGVAIEQESVDPEAGQLYFRDPAGNSVELVGGELWPV